MQRERWTKIGMFYIFLFLFLGILNSTLWKLNINEHPGMRPEALGIGVQVLRVKFHAGDTAYIESDTTTKHYKMMPAQHKAMYHSKPGFNTIKQT